MSEQPKFDYAKGVLFWFDKQANIIGVRLIDDVRDAKNERVVCVFMPLVLAQMAYPRQAQAVLEKKPVGHRVVDWVINKDFHKVVRRIEVTPQMLSQIAREIEVIERGGVPSTMAKT